MMPTREPGAKRQLGAPALAGYPECTHRAWCHGQGHVNNGLNNKNVYRLVTYRIQCNVAFLLQFPGHKIRMKH